MEMDKLQTHEFLTEYIQQLDPNVVISENAFEEIFQLLDDNGNGLISKDEISNFIKTFTGEELQQQI